MPVMNVVLCVIWSIVLIVFNGFWYAQVVPDFWRWGEKLTSILAALTGVAVNLLVITLFYVSVHAR